MEGREHDLPAVQAALEKRWKELVAKYEVEKKKDPEFALPPDESLLPRPAPKRIWQQGEGRWHVDAPVAVVEDRVLAASAYLDDEKAGERALVCLKAADGAVLWKTPLKLNPWAGPTVGPYVLVGCSSIRLEPKAIAGAKGEVVAIELDTGKVKWRKEVPGGVLSSVVVKAGIAFFKVRAWDAFTGHGPTTPKRHSSPVRPSPRTRFTQPTSKELSMRSISPTEKGSGRWTSAQTPQPRRLGWFTARR